MRGSALDPSAASRDEKQWDHTDERRIWSFYLGPDSLGIDDENLHIVFDERGRVKNVSIGEG